MRLTIADRVSLMRLQSFSCDTSKSKKCTDYEKDNNSHRSKCEDEIENDYDTYSQDIARRCWRESKKFCGNTQRKNTCASSQDVDEEQQERNSNFNKNYTNAKLNQKRLHKRDKKQCSEKQYFGNQKYDENNAQERLLSKNCTRQDSLLRDRASRDSNCSQKQDYIDIDRNCNKSNADRHNNCYNNSNNSK